MRKVDELRNVIANQFACEYKTYDFGDIRRTEKYEKILRRKTWFTYKATTDRF